MLTYLIIAIALLDIAYTTFLNHNLVHQKQQKYGESGEDIAMKRIRIPSKKEKLAPSSSHPKYLSHVDIWLSFRQLQQRLSELVSHCIRPMIMTWKPTESNLSPTPAALDVIIKLACALADVHVIKCLSTYVFAVKALVRWKYVIECVEMNLKLSDLSGEGDTICIY
ncbi:uncharacterized protein LOC121049463 [Rosa chinensis]|uniref:uncharacterized protein LOC121049463 n=1 Tax=Rosa chinensis TaxID=74649 RepID=UPI001AD92280|nr:uncharacterized protein LOC121049463 [Rosa chinensis]